MRLIVLLDYKNLRDQFIKIFRGFFTALIIGMPSYANTAGFDYPLGSPGGSGYSNDVGGLTYVEPYTYPEPCGYTYHPGEDWNDDDTGLDYDLDSNDAGDPVFAISDGIIEYAILRSEAWGNIILIRHDGMFMLPSGGSISTVWSQYAHLANIGINPRTNQQWKNTDIVYKGEQIGAVGDYPQGSDKAYHLHFEIRKESVAAYSFPCKKSKEQVKAVYIEPSLFIQNNRASLTNIFTITPSTQSVNEGAGTATFSLARSDNTTAQTVHLSTLQNLGSTNVGDYIGKLDEQLTFAIGDTAQDVIIIINNDAEIENDETFGLIIEDTPGGTTLATASFTVVGDDFAITVSSAACSTPIVGETMTCTINGTNLPELTQFEATNCNPSQMDAIAGDSDTQRQFTCIPSVLGQPVEVSYKVPGFIGPLPLVPAVIASESPPASPINIQANSGDAESTVSWDSVTGATSYNIYWSTLTSVSKSDNKISNVVSPYDHTGLTNDTTYYYVVTALNSAGESSISNEVQILVELPPAQSSYVIGDTGPAGGIVFYVTDDALHGLEAAPQDSAPAAWGCIATVIDFANGDLIGEGEQNTAEIISGCPGTSAASVAASYGPGWFLPNRDEIAALYAQRAVVGGFTSRYYWSSSKALGFTCCAIEHDFDTGDSSFLGGRKDINGVRAVRAF